MIETKIEKEKPVKEMNMQKKNDLLLAHIEEEKAFRLYTQSRTQ